VEAWGPAAADYGGPVCQEIPHLEAEPEEARDGLDRLDRFQDELDRFPDATDLSRDSTAADGLVDRPHFAAVCPRRAAGRRRGDSRYSGLAAGSRFADRLRSRRSAVDLGSTGIRPRRCWPGVTPAT
jgi:hypothetical protein